MWMLRRTTDPGSRSSTLLLLCCWALSVLLCGLLPTTTTTTTTTGSLPPIASSSSSSSLPPPITGSSSLARAAANTTTATHPIIYHPHEPRLLQPPTPTEGVVTAVVVVSQDVVLTPGSLASGAFLTTDQVARLASELAALAAETLVELLWDDTTNDDDTTSDNNSVACDVQSQRDVGNDSVSVRALEFACTFSTTTSSGDSDGAQRFVDTLNDHLDALTEAWQSAGEGLDGVIFQALPMVLVSSSTSIPAVAASTSAPSTTTPPTTTPVAAPPTVAPAGATTATTNSPQQEPSAAATVTVTGAYTQQFVVQRGDNNPPSEDLFSNAERSTFAEIVAGYTDNLLLLDRNNSTTPLATPLSVLCQVELQQWVPPQDDNNIFDNNNNNSNALLQLDYSCQYTGAEDDSGPPLRNLPALFVVHVNANLPTVTVDLQALGVVEALEVAQQQPQVADSEPPTAAPATADDSVVVVTAVYVQEFGVAPTAELWTAQEQGQFASLMARYSRNVGAAGGDDNAIIEIMETDCHIVHHILILDTANTAMLMVEYECEYQSLSSSLPSSSESGMDPSTLPLRFVTAVNGNLPQVAIDLQASGLEDVTLAHPVVLQTMMTNGNGAFLPTGAPLDGDPSSPTTPTSAANVLLAPSLVFVSSVLPLATGMIACLW